MHKKIYILVITILLLSCTSFSALANTLFIKENNFNSFSFNFFQQLNKNNNNLVASPYSLASVLAVLTYGARGETQTQLKRALHLSEQQNLTTLNQTLQQNQALLMTNALWAQTGLHYQPSFLQAIKNDNTFHFFQLNFAESDNATKKINAWISEQTKAKITELIPSGLLSQDTRLVLTNTLYFKDSWRYPFEKSATQWMPFITDENKKIQVPMMQQQHEFFYNENQQLQLLQLPYRNDHLAMLIVLPKTSLSDISAHLNDAVFNNLLQTSRPTTVKVYLPKFTISSTFSELTDTLRHMGITQALTSQADFSGLAQEPLFLSSVIQKAIIEVDEQGTTAAAATAAVIERTAIMMPKKPKIFRADHPFIFMIYDTRTNAILFIGKFTQNH